MPKMLAAGVNTVDTIFHLALLDQVPTLVRSIAGVRHSATCAFTPHESAWGSQGLIPLQQLWRGDRQYLKQGRMLIRLDLAVGRSRNVAAP